LVFGCVAVAPAIRYRIALEEDGAVFWNHGLYFWFSAILNGFFEVIDTEPLLLRKNREDIKYGTQE
jgi:hypothetical protein